MWSPHHLEAGPGPSNASSYTSPSSRIESSSSSTMQILSFCLRTTASVQFSRVPLSSSSYLSPSSSIIAPPPFFGIHLSLPVLLYRILLHTFCFTFCFSVHSIYFLCDVAKRYNQMRISICILIYRLRRSSLRLSFFSSLVPFSFFPFFLILTRWWLPSISLEE